MTSIEPLRRVTDAPRAGSGGGAPRVRLPLAWRLFGGTALVLAVVLAGSTWWTSRSADRAAAVAAVRGVAALRAEVGAYLEGDRRALEEGAAVFARAPTFRSLVAAGRAPDALDQAREAAEQLRAAWVQITDAEGVRLAKSDEPDAPAAPLTGSPLVQQALAGRSATAFGTLGDSALVHVVALPIEGASAGRVVGTLMVARALDPQAARGRQPDGGEVAFVVLPRAGGAVVSGATLAPTPELRAVLGRLPWNAERAADAAPLELSADRVRYLALVEPLRAATGRAVGGYAVLRARDVELAAFAELRRAMLAAGGVGLVVALVVSLLMARQVTRPLGRLAEAARRASLGEYAAPVVVRSRDEVGVLAASLQALLDDLREKQVLVEFARLTPARPAGRRWSSPAAGSATVGDEGTPTFATTPFERPGLVADGDTTGRNRVAVSVGGRAEAMAGEGGDSSGVVAGAAVGATVDSAVTGDDDKSADGAADAAGETPAVAAGAPPVHVVSTGLAGALAGIRGAADALRPGRRFAERYHVEAMIGAGATGVVFRVLDVPREERVALKVLRPDVAQTDPSALARLAREADAARGLDHPNIVRTYALGEHDGLHYLTMEYVEGETLRALLDAHGPLPPDAAAATVRQLCRALEHAHAHGVVHRDVKPHNAVVTRAGVLKVMDFGIARFAGASRGVTETGVLIGTPAYMAPEVLRGAVPDARADVYAAGAVLYECLVGVPPFEAGPGGPLVLLAQVLEEEPRDPQALRPEIPRALADLALEALAKDPARRPPTAAALADRLAPFA